MRALPERQPTDGGVTVQRPRDGNVYVSVTTDGREQSIRMSDFNACRVLAMLCILLELPIPKGIGKLEM